MTEADYQAAADRLGVDVAAVKAVAEVESSGVSFWDIGGEQRPPIRLESHWFGKKSGYRYNESHPNISTRAYIQHLANVPRARAWERFDEAAALDAAAAIEGSSWGAYQVMGYHWKALGYESPFAFRTAMDTEAGQLDAFQRYIYAVPAAHTALQAKDWYAFEIAYNGPAAGGVYARRMADAYARHAK